MKKLTTLACAILLSQSALAQLKIEEPKPKIKKEDKYLCSYHTRISEQDKQNSSGKALDNNNTKSNAAAILRQDRANFYEYKLADIEDESDCVFHKAENRKLFEQYVNKGKLDHKTIGKIIYANPMIAVDVYEYHVDIKLIDEECGCEDSQYIEEDTIHTEEPKIQQ